MMNTAVSIKNVKKTYGEVEALHNINVDVSEGELFGFIGPDGAGKTSLFRILVTLLLPTEGAASIFDMDVVKDFKKLRRILGYMPGRFSLYQDLTVEENLNFFATTFGTTIKENYYLIESIYKQIEPFKKRRAGALSGGMKQKLALSCALIHKPRLLVLDEPTTGVDAVSRSEFWDMLGNLKKMGITVVVSTPYMDEAGLCDRVALIQKGRLLSVDTPQNIMNGYDEDLWAVRSKNIYKLIEDLRQLEEVSSAFPFGEYVHVSTPPDRINQKMIENLLEKKGHDTVEVKKTGATIEDCFMKLMKN